MNKNEEELFVTIPLADFERIKAAVAEGHTDVAAIIAGGNRSTAMYETVTRLGFAMIQLSKLIPDSSRQTHQIQDDRHAPFDMSGFGLRYRAVPAHHVPPGYVSIKELASKAQRSYKQVYNKLSKRAFNDVVVVGTFMFVNAEKAEAFIAA